MAPLTSDDRRWRKQVSCAVLLAILSLFSLPAAAGDYTVAYAFDGSEHVETGSVECEYRSYCWINIEKAAVSLMLGFRDANHTRIDINVGGIKRGECCFFFDGVNSVSRDISESSLIRLHVYVGHFRRGNEFLQNAPIGLLYLKISQQK
jgi:hypothetical protein